VTLNPSRNTLPLENNTKSIDLEHLKNTTLIGNTTTEIQKIEKRITPDQSTTEKNTIAILFHSLENPKLDVNLQKLEIKFVKLNFSKLFLTF